MQVEVATDVLGIFLRHDAPRSEQEGQRQKLSKVKNAAGLCLSYMCFGILESANSVVTVLRLGVKGWHQVRPPRGTTMGIPGQATLRYEKRRY